MLPAARCLAIVLVLGLWNAFPASAQGTTRGDYRGPGARRTHRRHAPRQHQPGPDQPRTRLRHPYREDAPIINADHVVGVPPHPSDHVATAGTIVANGHVYEVPLARP